MTIRPDSSAPTHVGRYALLTKLGEGGMGIVHLAQGPDGQRVALKVLRPQVVGDQEARQRLAREVGSLTRVRSPWVAEMLDADPWAEVPYVVTRYVPGFSLHEHVATDGPVTGRDLHWLAGCLAEGLAAVHAADVLHRDVKPGNVLMEGRTPILIDFGLARVADDVRLTQTGWLLGTPGYLAPEILYGDEATPAADVHAWAATVAYAASGRAPYGRGPAMAVMDRTRRGQHDLAGIESPLAEVLAAALDPEPLERPLLEELLAWLRPLSTRPDLPPAAAPGALFAAPAPVADDFTLPLALAAQGSAPVAPGPLTPPTVPEPAAPGTQVLPTAVEPPAPPLPPAPPPAPPTTAGPTAPALPPVLPPVPPAAAMARMEEQFDQAWDPGQAFVVQPKPPLGERIRRWVSVGLGAVALGAGFAAAPWVAAAMVVLTVWLLRAGSLAASAVASRRTVRGVKWYDALRWIVTSPWHLVRAVTGTVVLVTWSAGLGVAAGLLGYALALDVPSTLLAGGATLGVALWSGPSSSRFRSPVSRVLDPLARRPVPWLLTCAVLLAVAAGLGLLVAGDGVGWFPWSTGPFGL
ncbi:serine/threonine-protein kinase [Nocardioides daeguensis]|uniref:Protein kinase domain-containing protein n=1 Tax=Nocardioides daeguensis TaxID=908359 RepID=A0ABP6WHF0_9ACTN|nr:serine/threonine-protein kinase [Nocardioides daeguensis]MBV6729150.1 serine/threonine protein kinase [Nocardioides daeguensis]MCR1774846.1 serine/threonine protein kinase [Nocardioides daeguensis]